VSYGEMDCHATLASFSLAQALASAHGRANARLAPPLLRVLALVLETGDAAARRLKRLMPLLRAIAAGPDVAGGEEPSSGAATHAGRGAGRAPSRKLPGAFLQARATS